MAMIGCSFNTCITRLVTWQTLVSGGGIVSHPAPLDTAALLDVEFWVGADGAVLRSRWLTVFAGWITFNCKNKKMINTVRYIRPLDECVIKKRIYISQLNMLWVLKRTRSMRQFF